VSKLELLQLFRESLGGEAATVVEGFGPTQTDRTLSTTNLFESEKYWHLAGYREAPTISALVSEMLD
jgi:hypothetical protein